MNFKKVSILAVALLSMATVNVKAEEAKAATDAAAVVNTDSINGDDFNVTFKKLEGRNWQAILTNSTRPFNIVIDDSEWLREIYRFEGLTTKPDCDTIFVQLSKGTEGFEFTTLNAGWKDILIGQTVVLTEIRSIQARTTKSYYSMTALEDDQVQYYASHTPSAKPAKNRRANATVPAPAADKKSKKAGKKNGKKRQMTEDELIQALESGADLSGSFTEETTGDPKFSK
jgi:hypothetical protein